MGARTCAGDEQLGADAKVSVGVAAAASPSKPRQHPTLNCCGHAAYPLPLYTTLVQGRDRPDHARHVTECIFFVL